MPYAYVLRSAKDGRHYYGSIKNLTERMKDHNRGKVRSTSSRRPLGIIYYEQYDSIQDARKRELFFKSIDGYNWLKGRGII
jgi:putative endonuclease